MYIVILEDKREGSNSDSLLFCILQAYLTIDRICPQQIYCVANVP